MVKMVTKKYYGDEDMGYTVPAVDMSPKSAKRALIHNENDGIYVSMPEQRKIALEIRAEEKK